MTPDVVVSYTYIYAQHFGCVVCGPHDAFDMGWLQLVGSIKLKVSFAKESYKRDAILQKRPIILSILLTVATPYEYMYIYKNSRSGPHHTSWCGVIYIYVYKHTQFLMVSYICMYIITHSSSWCHIYICIYTHTGPHDTTHFSGVVCG